MPIYAYKCADCGHTFDKLQKISDAALTECPQCKAPALHKLVTAAGFQLKGNGWYATDFSGKSAPAAPAAESSASAAPAAQTAAASPAPAPTPASSPATSA